MTISHFELRFFYIYKSLLKGTEKEVYSNQQADAPPFDALETLCHTTIKPKFAAAIIDNILFKTKPIVEKRWERNYGFIKVSAGVCARDVESVALVAVESVTELFFGSSTFFMESSSR